MGFGHEIGFCLSFRCSGNTVASYILDGTVGAFQDDGLLLIVDFRDREGSFNDGSELVSRLGVGVPVYAEVDLITVVDYFVVLTKTFVKVALVVFLSSLELLLCVCNRFHQPMFSILLEFYWAQEAWLWNVGGGWAGPERGRAGTELLRMSSVIESCRNT